MLEMLDKPLPEPTILDIDHAPVFGDKSGKYAEDMRAIGLVPDRLRSFAAETGAISACLSWTDGTTALFARGIIAPPLDIQARATDELIAILLHIVPGTERGRITEGPEHRLGLIRIAAGARLDLRGHGGTISVVLLLRAAALATICGADPIDLPAPLRLIARSGRNGSRSHPLPHVVERAARQIFTTAKSRYFEPLFLRAKANELLSLLVEHWHADAAATEEPAVAENDREGVERIRRLMERAPHEAHSIQDLARIACMNRTKLRSLFKRLCGATLFDFRMSRLMEQADQMLRLSPLSVAEIGYRLGYADPSGFNIAYRRYFGHPPGSVRRCDRAISAGSRAADQRRL